MSYDPLTNIRASIRAPRSVLDVPARSLAVAMADRSGGTTTARAKSHTRDAVAAVHRKAARHIHRGRYYFRSSQDRSACGSGEPNQRKRKSVKRCREVSALISGSGRSCWVSCHGWCWCVPAAAASAAWGTWLRACQGSAPHDGRGAARLRVPVTRVFSLYVVQAGSAWPARCGQGCPDSVQPGW